MSRTLRRKSAKVPIWVTHDVDAGGCWVPLSEEEEVRIELVRYHKDNRPGIYNPLKSFRQSVNRGDRSWVRALIRKFMTGRTEDVLLPVRATDVR